MYISVQEKIFRHFPLAETTDGHSQSVLSMLLFFSGDAALQRQPRQEDLTVIPLSKSSPEAARAGKAGCNRSKYALLVIIIITNDPETCQVRCRPLCNNSELPNSVSLPVPLDHFNLFCFRRRYTKNCASVYRHPSKYLLTSGGDLRSALFRHAERCLMHRVDFPKLFGPLEGMLRVPTPLRCGRALPAPVVCASSMPVDFLLTGRLILHVVAQHLVLEGQWHLRGLIFVEKHRRQQVEVRVAPPVPECPVDIVQVPHCV